MPWTKTSERSSTIEWERADGYATIRLRENPDGTWTVRLDRLYQAPEGQHYRRETVDSEDAARDIVESWQDAYDREAE